MPLCHLKVPLHSFCFASFFWKKQKLLYRDILSFFSLNIPLLVCAASPLGCTVAHVALFTLAILAKLKSSKVQTKNVKRKCTVMITIMSSKFHNDTSQTFYTSVQLLILTRTNFCYLVHQSHSVHFSTKGKITQYSSSLKGISLPPFIFYNTQRYQFSFRTTLRQTNAYMT